jgi:hypothetical protein
MAQIDNWKARMLDGNGSARQSGAPSVELAADHWDTYFRAVADTSQGALVSVEVARGSDARARTRAPRPLRAISYRRNEDVVTVDAGGALREDVVRFFIAGPRSIRVADGGDGPEILVRDVAGTFTLIRLFTGDGHDER